MGQGLAEMSSSKAGAQASITVTGRTEGSRVQVQGRAASTQPRQKGMGRGKNAREGVCRMESRLGSRGGLSNVLVASGSGQS